MKVVINTCFGGFGLSARAVKRLAELEGRECHFFVTQGSDFETLVSTTLEALECGETKAPLGMFSAFDIPNPMEVIGKSRRGKDGTYAEYNNLYSKHRLRYEDLPRDDAKLVQVVEELGGEHRKGASGMFAELTVVEIPDGVSYEIEEYDGNEHIAEVHRTWR